MKRNLAVLGLAVVLGLAAATAVEAGGWARGGFFSRGYAKRPLPAPKHYGAEPHYRYPHHYPTAQELYPKYYGGFHYRHLDNIGIPTGDIGIRGNGIYMSPW